MSEHTKEPWSVYEGEEVHGVLDSEGSHIADMWGKNGKALSNSRRIVACVNACRGLSTEDMEKTNLLEVLTAAAKDGDGFIQRTIEAETTYYAEKSLADELAAALERLMYDEEDGAEFAIAQEALAKHREMRGK